MMPSWRRLLLGGLGTWACGLGRAQSAAASHPFDQAVAAFATIDRSNPLPPGYILFTGASNIRRWSDLPWAFPGHHVVNHGFGGAQMSDLVRYAPRLVIPHRPKAVFIYAGDNDLAAGKSPETILADLDTFVREVHAALPDTVIGCIAVKPSPVRARLVPKVAAVDRLIARYCSSHPEMEYLDVYTPMLGPGGKPRPELFGKDGLHLNEQGYAIWRSVIRPVLDRVDPVR